MKNWRRLYLGEIKEAKYERIAVDDLILQQKHLNKTQMMQLRATFQGLKLSLKNS
jgi:hypothetical protein